MKGGVDALEGHDDEFLARDTDGTQEEGGVAGQVKDKTSEREAHVMVSWDVDENAEEAAKAEGAAPRDNVESLAGEIDAWDLQSGGLRNVLAGISIAARVQREVQSHVA